MGPDWTDRGEYIMRSMTEQELAPWGGRAAGGAIFIDKGKHFTEGGVSSRYPTTEDKMEETREQRQRRHAEQALKPVHYEGVGANITQEEEPRQIEMELRELEEALGHQHAAIEKLESRMSPFLNPSRQDDENLEVEDSIKSPLARRIREYRENIQRNSVMLIKLEQRIEL